MLICQPALPCRSMVCMALSVLPVSVISQRNKAYMAQLQHTVQVRHGWVVAGTVVGSTA